MSTDSAAPEHVADPHVDPVDLITRLLETAAVVGRTITAHATPDADLQAALIHVEHARAALGVPVPRPPRRTPRLFDRERIVIIANSRHDAMAWATNHDVAWDQRNILVVTETPTQMRGMLAHRVVLASKPAHWGPAQLREAYEAAHLVARNGRHPTVEGF